MKTWRLQSVNILAGALFWLIVALGKVTEWGDGGSKCKIKTPFHTRGSSREQVAAMRFVGDCLPTVWVQETILWWLFFFSNWLLFIYFFYPYKVLENKKGTRRWRDITLVRQHRDVNRNRKVTHPGKFCPDIWWLVTDRKWDQTDSKRVKHAQGSPAFQIVSLWI